jgi:hypothetical protein
MIQVGTARLLHSWGRPAATPLYPILSGPCGVPLSVNAPAARPTRLIAAALLGAAALPATAEAAVFTQPPGRCYVAVGPDPTQRQSVAIAAEGFAPNATIDVLVDGQPADSDGDGVPDVATADPAGKVVGSVRAPSQPEGERPFTLTLTQRDNPANTVSATSKVTALSLTLRPAQAPPSSKVRFKGRGFTGRGAVWAHYLYRGRVRKTVRLVRRTTGDCGTFAVRRRQIPVTRPLTGRWTLQVDQQRKYALQPDSVFVRLSIDVQRVLGAA